MAKEKINLDDSLSPGDIIELHFETLGGTWLRAAQLALIDVFVKRYKQFTMLSWELPDEHKAIITVRVEKTNPVILTAAIIGGIIISCGIVGWLMLKEAYKIVESPQSKVIAVSAGTIAVAVIAGLILSAIGKK